MLAVEVHDGDSSDLRFDMVLGVVRGGGAAAGAAPPSPIPCPSAPPLRPGLAVTVTRGPYLMAPAPDSITIRWRSSHAMVGVVQVALQVRVSMTAGL